MAGLLSPHVRHLVQEAAELSHDDLVALIDVLQGLPRAERLVADTERFENMERLVESLGGAILTDEDRVAIDREWAGLPPLLAPPARKKKKKKKK